jgi:hypothetical protein
MPIQTTNISLHRIDLAQQTIGNPQSISGKGDFDSYVSTLMDEIQQSTRYKSFRFPSLQTEVARQVLNVAPNNWEQSSQVIADRLFRVEKESQDRLRHMIDLRRGSLVQILGEVNKQKTVVITKVDHDEYLDEVQLTTHLGLPIRQRTQKVAVFTFEKNNSIKEIHVSDTNNKISLYWWKDFLEVEELRSSEKNTTLAFTSIDNVLSKEVRKKSKSDYWTLRNSVIGFFRSNEDFTFDDLLQSVFHGYTPDNSSLDMGNLYSKVKDLPTKHDFDSQFEVSISSIKARIKNEIKLAENLQLRITGEINNLDSLIDTGKAKGGRKFIRIYSDTGYDEFHK